jgi:hypothetical protein
VSLYQPRVIGYEGIRNECEDEMDSKAEQKASNEIQGNKRIISKLKELVKADELIFETIDILKNKCIYCEFVPIDSRTGEKPYIYIEYLLAETNRVEYWKF